MTVPRFVMQQARVSNRSALEVIGVMTRNLMLRDSFVPDLNFQSKDLFTNERKMFFGVRFRRQRSRRVRKA